MSFPSAFLAPLSFPFQSRPLHQSLLSSEICPVHLPSHTIHIAPHASTPSPPKNSFAHLQNGSDVRGVAAPLDPNAPVTLTDAAVKDIIAAFVQRVAHQKHKHPSDIRIALGRDSRITGPPLLNAAIVGAASVGAAVTDVGLSTTPAMFMTTVMQPYLYDCACMLTASHLPPNRNGIKFFTDQGSTNKQDVKQILTQATEAYHARHAYIPDNQQAIDAASRFNFLPIYADHLVHLIRKGCNHPHHYNRPLQGFKIVVDAGNGAAGFFAHLVLQKLGAQVVGQFLEPDGMFPNHVPNPENPKAMQMTVDTVLRVGADLGIIFDTDVDRSGVVDTKGTEINRNRLIALLARIVLRQYPGSTIVTDSVTSNGLKRFIEQHGGKHFRYRKGYKNVIDKGIELSKAGLQTELAIETSGHGAMKENYMLDDGAYLAVKILIEMVALRLRGDNRGIGGLLDGLSEPLEEKEFRLSFHDQTDFQTYGSNVVEQFASFARNVDGWRLEETNYEGYRVRVNEENRREGWLLLRQSLHDPVLPLNIESEIEGGISQIANVLLEHFFVDCSNVDVSQLTEHVGKTKREASSHTKRGKTL